MTTDARRAEIETIRMKIGIQMDRLETELEADGHNMGDCPLLCFERLCDHTHQCPICEEDGE